MTEKAVLKIALQALAAAFNEACAANTNQSLIDLLDKAISAVKARLAQ